MTDLINDRIELLSELRDGFNELCGGSAATQPDALQSEWLDVAFAANPGNSFSSRELTESYSELLDMIDMRFGGDEATVARVSEARQTLG